MHIKAQLIQKRKSSVDKNKVSPSALNNVSSCIVMRSPSIESLGDMEASFPKAIRSVLGSLKTHEGREPSFGRVKASSTASHRFASVRFEPNR